MPNVIRATDYRITQTQGDGWHVYQIRPGQWGAFAVGRTNNLLPSREAAIEWALTAVSAALLQHRRAS